MLGRKAARDLRRVWPQFTALVVMVVLGVTVLAGVYGSYANLTDAIDEAYEDQRFHDALLGFHPRPRADAEHLRDLDGVREADLRLVVEAPVSFPAGQPPVLATLVGVPDDGNPTIDQLRVRDGAFAQPGRDEIMLEAGFAAHHGLGPGAQATVVGSGGPENVTVAGIVASPEYLWPAKNIVEHMPDVLRRWGVVYVPESDLGRLVGLEGHVNQAVFLVDEEVGPDRFVQAASAAVGTQNVTVAGTRDSQASNWVLTLLVDSLAQIAFILPLLFLTIVGLSAYVVLTRFVYSERTTIGLLRALGYSPAAVFFHYAAYAPVVAVVGSVIGFAAGYALSFYVTDVFAGFANLQHVPIRIHWELLAIGGALALGFALAASYVPVRQAARLQPAEAMRPPAPASRPGRVLGRWVRLPGRFGGETAMALRDLARNPRRTLSTMIGLALAVSVLMVPQGLLDSVDDATEDALEEAIAYDHIMVLERPVPEAEVRALEDIEGVARAEPVIRVTRTLIERGDFIDFVVMGIPKDAQLIRLYDPEGRLRHVEDDGVFLSRVFERKGYEVGQSVPVEGQDLPVLGFVKGYGTTGYVSLATMQKLTGQPEQATWVLLSQSPGTPAELPSEVHERLPVATSQDREQIRADWDAMMDLFTGFTAILLVFAAAIALAIVFNTVTINVLENARDYATLRTQGMGTASVARIVTTGTLALTVPAFAVGLVLGRYLTDYFVSIYSSDLFVMETHITAVTYVLSAAVALAVALAAEVPSVRWIARMDLARWVRERGT